MDVWNGMCGMGCLEWDMWNGCVEWMCGMDSSNLKQGAMEGSCCHRVDVSHSVGKWQLVFMWRNGSELHGEVSLWANVNTLGTLIYLKKKKIFQGFL